MKKTVIIYILILCTCGAFGQFSKKLNTSLYLGGEIPFAMDANNSFLTNIGIGFNFNDFFGLALDYQGGSWGTETSNYNELLIGPEFYMFRDRPVYITGSAKIGIGISSYEYASSTGLFLGNYSITGNYPINEWIAASVKAQIYTVPAHGLVGLQFSVGARAYFPKARLKTPPPPPEKDEPKEEDPKEEDPKETQPEPLHRSLPTRRRTE